MAILAFLLTAWASANQNDSLTCVLIPQTSPCSYILNYSSAYVSSDICIDTLDFEVNATYWQWSTVSEECRKSFAYYMCASIYHPCDNNPPCSSVCQTLSVCGIPELQTIANLAGDEFLRCDDLPTTNCSAAPPISELSVVPIAHCENYTGQLCRDWVNYPIYVPFGWTQERLEGMVQVAHGLFTIANQNCLPWMGAWACHQAFMPCDQSAYAQVTNATLTYFPAFPQFPCHDTCVNYLQECSLYFDLDSRLIPNCSSLGALAGGQQCGVPSFFPDWPLPTQPEIVGTHNGLMITTKCHDFSLKTWNGTQVTCVRPLVKPDSPSPGAFREIFPGASCDLPCPASYLYTEAEWAAVDRLMYVAVPAFLLCTFLLISYIIFPERRKLAQLRHFIGLGWGIELCILIGMGAVRKDAPKGFRYIQCKDNVSAYPMGFNFCTFQAVFLFWGTLAIAAWWLIIAIDAYFTVVKQRKLVGAEVKKKEMIYAVVGYGAPTFLLLVFLASGGKLAGDNINVLNTCFLGPRTIQESGPALDLCTFWIPLLLVCVAGTGLMGMVLWELFRAQMKVRKTTKSGISIVAYLNLLSFIILFMFVFLWMFAYRMQYSGMALIKAKAVEWVECNVQSNGDYALCGDHPPLRYPVAVQQGMHFVIAATGLWIFLFKGISVDLYRDWYILWVNRREWREIYKRGTKRFKQQTGATNGPGTNKDKDDSIGSDPGSKMSFRGKKGSIGLDLVSASATAIGSDPSNGSPGTGSNPSNQSQQQQPRGTMAALRRATTKGYWTATQQVGPFKVRRWVFWGSLLLLLLLIIILCLALLTDKPIAIVLPGPATELGQTPAPAPIFSIKSLTLISFVVQPVNETHSLTTTNVMGSADNPCGGKCPIQIKLGGLSLDIALLEQNITFGYLSTEPKDTVIQSTETWGAILAMNVFFYHQTYAHAINNATGYADQLVRVMDNLLNDGDQTVLTLGSCSIQSGGLSLANLAVSQNITLQQLKLTIVTWNLQFSGNDSDGLIIEMNGKMTNPSNVGLSGVLGNVTLELYYNNCYIGVAMATNLTLERGDNPLLLQGRIKPLPGQSHCLDDVFSLYAQGEIAWIEAKGAPDDPKTVLINDARWLRETLRSVNVMVPLQGVPLNPVKNLTVQSMQIDFASSLQTPYLGLTVALHVQLPLYFPLLLQSITFDLLIYDDASYQVTSAVYGRNCQCQLPYCGCGSGDGSHNTVVNISCATMGVIAEIQFASYGTPSGDCPNNAINATCHYSQSLSVVQSLCLGQSTCQIPVQASTFAGYTCAGAANGTEYLRVMYTCAAAVGDPSEKTTVVDSVCTAVDSAECAVQLSPPVLGDPFPGCLKRLEINYTCYDARGRYVGQNTAIAVEAPNATSLLQFSCLGQAMAHFTTPTLTVNGNLINGDGTFTVNVPPSAMTIVNQTRFSDYIVRMITQSTVTQRLKGTTDQLAITPIGPVLVQGMRLSEVFSAAGMASFQTPPGIVVNKLDIMDGTPNVLDIILQSSIPNPSIITVVCGQVGFSIMQSNIWLGYISGNLTLNMGSNAVPMSGLYIQSPPNNSVAVDLLNNYVNSLSSSVALQPNVSLVANNYLALAFAQITLSAQFPGLALPRMVIIAYTNTPSCSISTEMCTLETRMVIENRFQASVQILAMNFALDMSGLNGGNLYIPYRAHIITLAPHARTLSSIVSFQQSIVAGYGQWLSGGVSVDISGTMTIGVGTFEQQLTYTQTGLNCPVLTTCFNSPTPSETDCPVNTA